MEGLSVHWWSYSAEKPNQLGHESIHPSIQFNYLLKREKEALWNWNSKTMGLRRRPPMILDAECNQSPAERHGAHSSLNSQSTSIPVINYK